MTNHAKKILWVTVVLIIIIVSYKIYAPRSIAEFNAINLKNIQQIKNNLDNEKKENYSFALVGNIKNSISIFDENILSEIRKNKPDFIISLGNNIVDGGEGKYRVLHRTLQRIDIPFVTGVGEMEIKDEGYKNFYKYFGPFYYAFSFKDSYFIFIDTTGHTASAWQKEWLESQLKLAGDYKHKFVIMNKPPLKLDVNYIIKNKKRYMEDSRERAYYQNIFSKYEVDSVFSSNMQLYHREKIQGVEYIISGGAGGELILDEKDSFYHYIRVDVTDERITYNLHKIDNTFTSLNSKVDKVLYNIWIALQSFLYTNYITILIIVLVIFLIGFLFYLELTREVDYYRDFAFLRDDFVEKKLNIAMFTNNYFPYIGGVPISIYRLAHGLKKKGHNVYIFAPDYKDNGDRDEVIRGKALFHYRKDGMDIPITNIFSKKIKDKFAELDIDLVHAHHPFWLGSKGMSLAEDKDLPIVFTYHTRLEKYAHYLPGFFILEALFKKRISHFIIRRFSNNCDAVFAPTGTAKEYLRNIGVSKYIEVMPTGVDLENYNAQEDQLESIRKKYGIREEKILFSVSRLSKEKNLYFLIDGIKYIKENTEIEFKFLLAGDGPEKENLAKYIKENDLAEYIELIGLVDHTEVSRYYTLADIFVFASKSETQGMVLLEAMAGRTPVVAVRSSGIDDIIENDFNGYKTREDIKEWSLQVIKIMGDDSLLSRLADNAVEVAEDNSVEKMAEKALCIYNKVRQLHG